MTNEDIIRAAKKANGIKEEIHTFAEWKKHGRAVSKGEHACLKVKIWVYTKQQVEVDEGIFEWQGGFVMKPTAFFGRSQTEVRG